MRSGAWIILGAVAIGALLVTAAFWFLPGVFLPANPGGPALGPNETTVDYASSVDGFPLSYSEWLPAGYQSGATYPLAIYLHHIEDTSGHAKPGGFWNQLSGDGGGPAVIAAASAAGFLLIAPNTRTGSGFYVDSNFTGPQQQDVFDAIAHEESLRHVSGLYLFGFSMGAMGTLYVALHHPSMFVGIGLIETATDIFETTAHFQANSAANEKAGNAIQGMLTVTGGQWPNASAYAQQMFTYMTVGRFDPAAFATLRTYVVEGQFDDVLPNNPTYWPYLEVNDTFLTSTCDVATGLDEPANCTTPVATLAAQNPGAYLFRYVYAFGGGHTLSNLDPADMFAFWQGQRGTGQFYCTVPTTTPLPWPPP